MCRHPGEPNVADFPLKALEVSRRGCRKLHLRKKCPVRPVEGTEGVSAPLPIRRVVFTLCGRFLEACIFALYVS